jgi:hypothetical protein
VPQNGNASIKSEKHGNRESFNNNRWKMAGLIYDGLFKKARFKHVFQEVMAQRIVAVAPRKQGGEFTEITGLPNPRGNITGVMQLLLRDIEYTGGRACKAESKERTRARS